MPGRALSTVFLGFSFAADRYSYRSWVNRRDRSHAGEKLPSELSATPDGGLATLLSAVRTRQRGARILVAIAGPPGAGKSTLARRLVDALNLDAEGCAALLGQDGFHYDDRVLAARGDRDRKGAPHTFDVAGLRALLARLVSRDEDVVAIPVFDRRLEIARAGAALVPRAVEVVVVEGNYLLLGDAPWPALRPFFDLTVLLEIDPATLRQRLLKRWRDHGFDAAAAAAKVETNDLPNARLVEARSAAPDILLVDGRLPE